ncbi:ABC transporter ATP-binding protein [Actinopolymorpha singaporensis]|uniref:Energy-coupling factor transport system ATP-binding protein n=1 Tax=Actinopolymorpha singaporensis TaxID=117157 RepID=A0A1H1XDQ5_9ACTN|nr:ATP-binding cassette domain-containing protein [Actinopolymorpha singaporensis]SDT07280.1 energy-coupling factor transport system ATP-binding protein [Actinopolymorpha singaporensis]
MIRFESVTVRYPGAASPVLQDVTFEVAEGELCLVVGQTGAGKSTLLRAVNGLVPHFTGGTMAGRVLVDGRDTRTHRPRDLADVVGVVGQDPLAGFVTDTVEDELAYGMESLGLPPDVMRTRVEETLDLLGLAGVRGRPIASLSGGQQQRVAIGAVLTTHPRILVLDEPTSALDPQAAEEVLAALQRLVHDLGVTVLLAEHRLERVVQYADRVVLVHGTGHALEVGPPAQMMARSSVAPPVVALGRLAGWEPLPLSVRDARRMAGPLRERLAPLPPPVRAGVPRKATSNSRPSIDTVASVATVHGLTVRYGGRRSAQLPAVRDLDLDVTAGEVVALMGRNGAGKSTLLGSLVGLVRPVAGTVRVGGEDPVDPATAKPRTIARAVGLVPQDPSSLLYAETVAQECGQADRDFDAPAGSCARLLERLAPGVPPDRHPRDLSEGQRLCLALAVVLTGQPPLLLLDEPTRGLDYTAKARLTRIVRDLAAAGHGVVFATHDVELVAEVATRVVVLADGEVVADGPVGSVVAASPTFAPQVAKILRPLPWLTVADVAAALEPAS